MDVETLLEFQPNQPSHRHEHAQRLQVHWQLPQSQLQAQLLLLDEAIKADSTPIRLPLAWKFVTSKEDFFCWLLDSDDI
jgi:hypothetical protein